MRNSEVLYVDLLLPNEEMRLMQNPELLIAMVREKKYALVILDEIQKLPKLLDVVHYLIENDKIRFALTGSSARKLRRGHANLLAGRAVIREMFPLTSLELGDKFVLQEALKYGTLPAIFKLGSFQEKRDFLESYAHSYLREEIFAEALIRRIEPFRKFVQLAAQNAGKLINMTTLAKAAGVDHKTVKSYYSILEDTLLGFFLEPYLPSIQKRLTKSPKFYFFDTGVARALADWMTVDPIESTSYFRELFEQWLVAEIFRVLRYRLSAAKLYFYSVHDCCEVDLVIEYPKQNPIFVEIKSTTAVKTEHLKNLEKIKDDFPNSKFVLTSRDVHSRNEGNIRCEHWQTFLQNLT